MNICVENRQCDWSFLITRILICEFLNVNQINLDIKYGLIITMTPDVVLQGLS